MRSFRIGFFGCLGVGAAIVVVIIVAAIFAGLGKTQSTSSVITGQVSTLGSSAATGSPPATSATVAATSKFASFGDGAHTVGTEIQPGTYRTRTGSPGCYFARLKGFGGTVDDVLANENTDAPAVVTITATDKGFESQRCSRWTADLSAITLSTNFGDGDYIVGTDIQPGTYKNSGQQGCYYARLSGFGHTVDDVIANDNTDNVAIVTIAPTDKGFEATRCGTWTKVG
jgi:hypothetical protein